MYFVNEHRDYADLDAEDRLALRDVLRTAFAIGESADELWSDFVDTTVFLRRVREVGESAPPRGVIGGAIVMGQPLDQFDYLAYIAIHPAYRHRRRLFSRDEGPRHGTRLLHYVYDVMRTRVDSTRMQRHLLIEPMGDAALDFYLQALPPSDFPVKVYEADNIISVAYDGLDL